MPKLHEQREELKARIEAAREELAAFNVYLSSDKFQGYDPRDGMENDYVRTWEVRDLLRRVIYDCLKANQEVA